MDPSLEPTIDIPQWLEILAVVAGALAASTRAVKERLALSGVVALAVAGGLGGGIIRDVLLQNGTPLAFTDPWLLPVALISAIPALILAPVVRTLKWPMYAIGALSLGIYSVLGADRALLLDLPAVGAILIGVLSGTGGGVLADLAVGVPPALFRPGVLQGVAAAIGTVVFVVGVNAFDERAAFFIAGVATATAVRMISLVANLKDVPAEQIVETSERMIRRVPLPHPPASVRRLPLFRRPSDPAISDYSDPEDSR